MDDDPVGDNDVLIDTHMRLQYRDNVDRYGLKATSFLLKFPPQFSLHENQDIIKETLRQMGLENFSFRLNFTDYIYEYTKKELPTHQFAAIVVHLEVINIMFRDQANRLIGISCHCSQNIKVFSTMMNFRRGGVSPSRFIYQFHKLIKHNICFAMRKSPILLIESHHRYPTANNATVDCESFGYNYMMNQFIFKDIMSYISCCYIEYTRVIVCWP